MKKDKKKLFLDIGVFFSATLCFLCALGVLYHSSRHPVQAMGRHPEVISKTHQVPVAATAMTVGGAIKDGAHQKMLSEALRKKPDHVPVLLELARLESESGNGRKASEYLREVLQYEPQNPEAKLNLGKQLFEMGKTDEAISLNQEILQAQPLHPDALYNLGAIYGNLGNRERAFFYWEKLIDSSPDSESGKRAAEMMARM
jgi:tetratricopeptide (TPR) repeat protein